MGWGYFKTAVDGVSRKQKTPVNSNRSGKAIVNPQASSEAGAAARARLEATTNLTSANPCRADDPSMPATFGAVPFGLRQVLADTDASRSLLLDSIGGLDVAGLAEQLVAVHRALARLPTAVEEEVREVVADAQQDLLGRLESVNARLETLDTSLADLNGRLTQMAAAVPSAMLEAVSLSRSSLPDTATMRSIDAMAREGVFARIEDLHEALAPFKTEAGKLIDPAEFQRFGDVYRRLGRSAETLADSLDLLERLDASLHGMRRALDHFRHGSEGNELRAVLKAETIKLVAAIEVLANAKAIAVPVPMPPILAAATKGAAGSFADDVWEPLLDACPSELLNLVATVLPPASLVALTGALTDLPERLACLESHDAEAAMGAAPTRASALNEAPAVFGEGAQGGPGGRRGAQRRQRDLAIAAQALAQAGILTHSLRDMLDTVGGVMPLTLHVGSLVGGALGAGAHGGAAAVVNVAGQIHARIAKHFSGELTLANIVELVLLLPKLALSFAAMLIDSAASAVEFVRSSAAETVSELPRTT